jgi:predicted dithiol-disulfide oxidoreductase (DUF899 family)
MISHPVVSREDWTRARRDLLAREKEVTRLRDEISRQRRELPWVRIEQATATKTASCVTPTRATPAVSTQ